MLLKRSINSFTSFFNSKLRSLRFITIFKLGISFVFEVNPWQEHIKELGRLENRCQHSFRASFNKDLVNWSCRLLSNYKWLSVWHNYSEIAFPSVLFFFFLAPLWYDKDIAVWLLYHSNNQICIYGLIYQAQL